MEIKHIVIPQWLDKIIFDDFDAVYEPRPMDVVYNADQPFDFVKLYLGTYFPRSYAEAFGITTHLLSHDTFVKHLLGLKDINILDFCCGTGGEIIGTIVALQSYLPNLKRINIDAFDANSDAVCFLHHLIESVNNAEEIKIKININPQCVFVESEQEIQDIVNYTNVQYQFIMSYKAINEFIQHKTFESNAYELVASHFLPLLSQHGAFIMTDISSRLDKNTPYYPQLMNTGLNNYIRKSSQYKSIIPASCFNHENACAGCYMQDSFLVTHRKKTRDISKVAYRVVCRTELANEILCNRPIRACRATNQMADKNLPYNN